MIVSHVPVLMEEPVLKSQEILKVPFVPNVLRAGQDPVVKNVKTGILAIPRVNSGQFDHVRNATVIIMLIKMPSEIVTA